MLNEKALEAACEAHAPQWGGIDPEIQKYGRQQMEDAITAYLAALPLVEVGVQVERLRESALGHGPTEGGLRDEAASLIQSQAARIAALEAGMKPFADRYDAWGDTAEGVYTYEDYTPRMVSDFARARALLNRRAEG